MSAQPTEDRACLVPFWGSNHPFATFFGIGEGRGPEEVGKLFILNYICYDTRNSIWCRLSIKLQKKEEIDDCGKMALTRAVRGRKGAINIFERSRVKNWSPEAARVKANAKAKIITKAKPKLRPMPKRKRRTKTRLNE